MSVKFIQRLSGVVCLSGVLWALGLAGPRASGQEIAAVTPSWQPRFQGVAVAELKASEPRGLRAVALRIDLRAKGLSFLATPDNGERPGETDAQLTSHFLEAHGLQAAINAAPFDKVHSVPGQPQDVLGLLVSQGKKVSAAGKRPALVIDKENCAWIAQPGGNLKGAWNAVGGFAVILRAGELTRVGDQKLHPRTAAGVSRDGRWLYWLVVDGRQFGWSGGVTTDELGVWLKHLGAWDAINLDGGGTSTLVLSNADGKAEILNRPVHNGLPGLERLAGCHLGLKALPLPTQP